MADADGGQKLKVFISYSRRDSSDFAEELVAGLALAGFAAFLDRHDIAAGEDWAARLGGLIDGADTVVFVVSPEAVKSERCAWEVERTLAQAKRLLPVIFKPVPETEIPEALRRLQFVRFDAGPGITRPLGQLADALRHDLDWIREHTRLGETAARWQARGRPESLLLRGEDLAAAQSWADRWRPGAPAVTDPMRAFIAASREAEAVSFARTKATHRRLIQIQAVMYVLLVGVILGLIGWINQSAIERQWTWYRTVRPFAAANIWPYVLTAAAESALKPKDTFRECAAAKDYCPAMVVVGPGSFTMGSPDAEPDHVKSEAQQHLVTFAQSFAVSKFELTFDEWDNCAAYGDCPQGISDSGFGRGRQPAINVTWDEAQAYAAWLSKMTGKTYRLLSEAEYEYAARGGTQTAFPWGHSIALDGTAMANCKGCGSQWDFKQTAPVGSFAANAFGLYDMIGNVFEWAEDCVHTSYEGAPLDGSAWIAKGNCGSRLIRGGSWASDPSALRAAARNWINRDLKLNAVGFRVARTLAPVN